MIRNGLAYDLSHSYGDPVYVYAPARGFEVDGIRYPDDPDLYCPRPMIELLDDVDPVECAGATSTQRWSCTADSRWGQR